MNKIKAEITGIIQSIEVTAGDTVTAGQLVLNIESMKMIIPIDAPVAGIIDEIKVSLGDFVNEGDVLATLL